MVIKNQTSNYDIYIARKHVFQVGNKVFSNVTQYGIASNKYINFNSIPVQFQKDNETLPR